MSIVEKLRADAINCEMCDGEPRETWLSWVAADEIARLRKALEDVVRDIIEYERINNLGPNPGRTACWDSVARAKAALSADQ